MISSSTTLILATGKITKIKKESQICKIHSQFAINLE